MCDFTTDTPPATELDPRKRVRHFTGLVMGVAEFQQDQTYFMARDELHQRALHGYGVVSGLGVSVRIDPATGDPEVVVAAGVAVNPRGESICVPQAQCASLNEWLETNRDTLLGSPPALPPGEANLYLVLCARDCETDQVPVLGDPCRTLEDATAASRYADDFELCLRLEPPQQLEEDAVRRLGELLRSIEISEAPGGLSPQELADLVRDLAPSGSPPEVGEIDLDGSPPLELTLHPDDAAEALEAAYRAWIHEVRPALNPETGACEVPRDGDDGRCLLIACLTFDFSEGADGLEVASDVEVDTCDGPILVQTRVLQELLLAGLYGQAAAPALGSPPAASPASHSDLLDLDADDHEQYLRVTPAADPADRDLITDLDAAGNLVTGLGEAGSPTGSEAVRWDRAVKNGDPAGGDLSGTYPDPEVAALQGNPVAPGGLGPGDAGSVLFWNGSQWMPSALPLEEELIRIVDLSWGHDGNTRLAIRHDSADAFGLAIGFGLRPGERAPVSAATLNSNTFRVFIRRGDEIQPGGLPIFQIAELRPSQAVIPVDVVAADPVTGLIVETALPDDERLANGAFFPLSEDTATALVEQRQQLFVQLAGDHVLDPDGRAIDAEFPRAGLPSGDGPGGARLGVQGGRFESWVTCGRRVIRVDGRDINLVDASVLRELPGIGPVLANRIVALREARNGFASLEELRDVQGMTTNTLDNLRSRLDRR